MQLAERGRVDGFARFDAGGAAVGGDDGDHFGLFEGLEGGFAVGFEDVGEEEFVVAEGVGEGEEFDEEPGLLARPLAWVGVEDVHFEDLGGGLICYFADGFCCGMGG